MYVCVCNIYFAWITVGVFIIVYVASVLTFCLENSLTKYIAPPVLVSDDGLPDEYLCPITREVMRDPVIASGTCSSIMCACYNVVNCKWQINLVIELQIA